jgi:hypothetical protein
MHCLLMCIPAPSATDVACTDRLKQLKQYAVARGELLPYTACKVHEADLGPTSCLAASRRLLCCY